MRKHINAGELYALQGRDSKVTQWMLWDRLRADESEPGSDYMRWQGRLAPSIAEGIAEDFGLKTEMPEVVPNGLIKAPKCWAVKPHELTMGHKAMMIVTQKTGQAMRDWKAPDQPSARDATRMKAVAAAYGVDVVLLGTLVDGYTGQIYRIKTDEEERAKILEDVAAFIKMVEDDEEPDFDVESDRTAVRQGKVGVAKLEASSGNIENLLKEREAVEAQVLGFEAQASGPKKRLDQINTILIGLAAKGPIQTENVIVSVTETASGVKRLKVDKKAKKALF